MLARFAEYRGREANRIGIDQARPGPLVDVLLRAALAGDAEVIVSEAGLADSPTDGVGALLLIDLAAPLQSECKAPFTLSVSFSAT